MALVVKNLPANTKNASSTPRSGSSPKKEMATHSSVLAWKIPWTEEPGGSIAHGVAKSWI